MSGSAFQGLLKKPFGSAGRNPFLPDHQASQGRQERIPDDARRIVAFSTVYLWVDIPLFRHVLRRAVWYLLAGLFAACDVTECSVTASNLPMRQVTLPQHRTPPAKT